MRKKIYIFALVVVISMFSCISAFAEEIPESEEINDVLYVEEDSSPTEYNVIVDFPDYPLPVYEVNPDDYNGVSTYAITGDVYQGSYNTTATSLWNGVLANNVGKDYLAFRRNQYEYIMFVGEDFNYSGGRFTGSGTYYLLNTNNQNYNYSTGTDSFNINPSGNYVFTNVSEDFPALDTERGLVYGQIQTIAIIALLGFSLLRWIFIGR